MKKRSRQLKRKKIGSRGRGEFDKEGLGKEERKKGEKFEGLEGNEGLENGREGDEKTG